MSATVISRDILRAPLREKCLLGKIDLTVLTSFCRILLTTDGTLTELLEANFLEPIQLIKLSEAIQPAAEALSALNLQLGEMIIERNILLQGQHSRKNYVYAKSRVIVDGLEEAMRRDLLLSKTPIGRLWLDHKMETFKEIIDIRREPAGELARYFALDAGASLLSRTYRVFSKHRPIILITEKFPEHFRLT